MSHERRTLALEWRHTDTQSDYSNSRAHARRALMITALPTQDLAPRIACMADHSHKKESLHQSFVKEKLAFLLMPPIEHQIKG